MEHFNLLPESKKWLENREETRDVALETKDEAVQVDTEIETIEKIDTELSAEEELNQAINSTQTQEITTPNSTEGLDSEVKSSNRKPNETLILSLQSLSTELKNFVPSPPTSTAENPATPQIETYAQQSITSLESLNSFISTQTFFSSQNYLSQSSMTAVGYNFGRNLGQTSGNTMAEDKVGMVKSEIRALKGLFLNR